MFGCAEKTLEFNVLVSNTDLQHLKEKLRSPVTGNETHRTQLVCRKILWKIN